MADREKVLEGLESCAKSDPENWCYHMCEHCPYDLTAGCKHILAADALELLKDQKAEGYWIQFDLREHATISAKCSCCGWEAHYYEDDVAGMPYCPNCGAKMKAVKRDD